MKLKISKIVEAFDIELPGSLSFIDTETSETYSIERVLLGEVESGSEAEPGEEDQEWHLACRVLTGKCFERLPLKSDINEWEIMRDFADAFEDDRVRSQMLDAIHGRGAFRHFQDTVYRLRIQKQWYDFRESAFRDAAIRWCEENGYEWE